MLSTNRSPYLDIHYLRVLTSPLVLKPGISKPRDVDYHPARFLVIMGGREELTDGGDEHPGVLVISCSKLDEPLSSAKVIKRLPEHVTELAINLNGTSILRQPALSKMGADRWRGNQAGHNERAMRRCTYTRL